MPLEIKSAIGYVGFQMGVGRLDPLLFHVLGEGTSDLVDFHPDKVVDAFGADKEVILGNRDVDHADVKLGQPEVGVEFGDVVGQGSLLLSAKCVHRVVDRPERHLAMLASGDSEIGVSG